MRIALIALLAVLGIRAWAQNSPTTISNIPPMFRAMLRHTIIESDATTFLQAFQKAHWQDIDPAKDLVAIKYYTRNGKFAGLMWLSNKPNAHGYPYWWQSVDDAQHLPQTSLFGGDGQPWPTDVVPDDTITFRVVDVKGVWVLDPMQGRHLLTIRNQHGRSINLLVTGL